MCAICFSSNITTKPASQGKKKIIKCHVRLLNNTDDHVPDNNLIKNQHPGTKSGLSMLAINNAWMTRLPGDRHNPQPSLWGMHWRVIASHHHTESSVTPNYEPTKHIRRMKTNGFEDRRNKLSLFFLLGDSLLSQRTTNQAPGQGQRAHMMMWQREHLNTTAGLRVQYRTSYI